MSSNPTSYRGPDVEACAHLSECVYEPTYKLRRRVRALALSRNWNLVDLVTISFQNGESRVMVAVTDDDVYVVFRGTVPTRWTSWRVNATGLGRRQWLKGTVHVGYLRMLMQAKYAYRRLVRSAANKLKPITFTGHSQGGAIAFLAAMDETRRRDPRAASSSVTFGQPRCGDRTYCRTAEGRIGTTHTRVTNSRDSIPGVPPVSLGFDHFRYWFHYTRRGKVRRRSQAPGGSRLFSLSGLLHHPMKKYVSKAAANQQTFL
jgi:hypothetical protein